MRFHDGKMNRTYGACAKPLSSKADFTRTSIAIDNDDDGANNDSKVHNGSRRFKYRSHAKVAGDDDCGGIID
eukprot:scaffold186538_cov29-Prasinocladus_malaysianus.AAC.1